MKLPDTLPARMYLLAYQPSRGRHVQRTDLGLILRAAALVELLQRGLLVDGGGKGSGEGEGSGTARPGSPAPAGLDPVLAGVLDQIEGSRPRRWEHWVRTGDRATARAVRDQLVADGTLDLEERRVLGLFPALRPVPSDPAVREHLLTAFAAALDGPLPQVEPWQAAMVTLAAEGRLHNVLAFRRRRELRDRIKELAQSAGPVPKALRRALDARHSSQGG